MSTRCHPVVQAEPRLSEAEHFTSAHSQRGPERGLTPILWGTRSSFPTHGGLPSSSGLGLQRPQANLLTPHSRSARLAKARGPRATPSAPGRPAGGARPRLPGLCTSERRSERRHLRCLCEGQAENSPEAVASPSEVLSSLCSGPSQKRGKCHQASAQRQAWGVLLGLKEATPPLSN